MSRASKERERVERIRGPRSDKRAVRRLDKRAAVISRVTENTENGVVFLQAAAVHEAAHVIAAFHWNVPIGKRGVYIEPSPDGNDAGGYSDVLWNEMDDHESSVETNHAISYMSWVGSVIAPFAEYQYRYHKADAHLDLENLLSSGRMDFAEPLGPDATHKATMNYGRACFLLWMGGEKRIPAGWLDSEMGVLTQDLVHDADMMLRAYGKQIATFANAILGADGLQMTPGDVAQWRDEHFQRCDVALSARANCVR